MYILKLAEKISQRESRSMKILDLGCGNGSVVFDLINSGLDAYGADIKFKQGANVSMLENAGRIRKIKFAEVYQLPFDDGEFDLVFSEQVMEHVQDHHSVASEIARVLKRDGVSIHRFPSRLRPIESHVFVPFSSVIRLYPWIIFWTALGFHKKKQKGMSISKIASVNIDYLNSSTNYLNGRDLQEIFYQYFDKVYSAPRDYLDISPNFRGRLLGRISRIMPMLLVVYEMFGSRTLVLRLPKK